MQVNVRDYFEFNKDGLCTLAFQKAIDECFSAGGGKVIVPKGCYLVAGFRLRSNVTLYLESGATLMGSANSDDYNAYKTDSVEPFEIIPTAKNGSVDPFSRWSNGLIRVFDAENVSIIGEEDSVIDGVNCYDPNGEEKFRGPHAISIWNSKGVTLKGYTIKDSANWAHAIFNTSDISCANVRVLGGHDGFDIRTCDNVVIQNCEFLAGDDSIAGFDNHNVLVKNCVLNSACSLIRFGGTDVVFDNIRGFDPPKYHHRGSTLTAYEKRNRLVGCRLGTHNECETVFKYYCDFRAEIRKTPGNIIIKNSNFSDIKSILIMTFTGEHAWCCNRPLESITFENCVFEGIRQPMLVYGGSEDPITVTLNNCTVIHKQMRESMELAFIHNFKELKVVNLKVLGLKEYEVVAYCDGKVTVENCNIPVKVIRKQDGNQLKAILKGIY